MVSLDQMGAFLIAAMFMTVSAQNSVKRSSRTNVKCEDYRFVPAHNHGGEGFDVTTMQRKVSSIIDMGKDLGPGGYCKTVQNPHIEGHPIQKLPAAIESWKSISQCSHEFVADSYDHASGLTEDMASNVGSSWSVGLSAEVMTPVKPGVSVGGGRSFSVAGSHSEMVKFANDVSKSMQGKFVKLSLTCALYQYSLPLYNSPLTPSYIDAVKNLPVEYNEDKYRQFINQYGTHYYHKVTLGGRIDILTAANKCVLKEVGLSNDEAKNCLRLGASASLKASLEGVGSSSGSVGASYNRCKEKIKSTGRFSDINSVFSSRFTQVFGGNTEGLASAIEQSKPDANQEFDRWLQTLQTNPEIIGQDLRPLYESFDHVKCSDVSDILPKKRNLHKAIENYLQEKRSNVGLCKKVCSYKCPGTLDDDCNCKCDANKDNDGDCCPNQVKKGRYYFTDLYANVYGDDSSQSDNQLVFRGAYRPESQFLTWYDGDEVEDVPSLPRIVSDTPRWVPRNGITKIAFGILPAGALIKMELLDDDHDPNWDDLLITCHVKAETGDFKCIGDEYNKLYGRGVFECIGMLTGPQCDRFDEAKYQGKPGDHVCPVPEQNLPANSTHIVGSCNARSTSYRHSGARAGRLGFVNNEWCIWYLFVQVIVFMNLF